ncbi:MAG: hypothetical protein IJW10_00240 [Clostridia bacterium]|nr:hypothetical protein [Clostridia bacterium]
MKKLLLLALAICLCFSAVACDDDSSSSSVPSSSSTITYDYYDGTTVRTFTDVTGRPVIKEGSAMIIYDLGEDEDIALSYVTSYYGYLKGIGMDEYIGTGYRQYTNDECSIKILGGTYEGDYCATISVTVK